MNAVGIDVGLVLHKPTSGLCKTGDCGFAVAHATADQLSRADAIAMPDRIDLLAIDGPVLARGELHFDERPAEKTFIWNPFRRRCAVGDTRRGIGAALRRGGCDTARQFADLTSASRCTTNYPQVQSGRQVIEAFPNAFLGVMLSEDQYTDPMPTPKRGGRFEWLLDCWRDRGQASRLKRHLNWSDPHLWRALRTIAHHEEQAGLLCALTAICVLQNAYTAIGEPEGGYLFLPPWSCWADWAKQGIDRNRRDSRLTRPVDVWINGERYAAIEALPK